jgi:hypothetical protein
MALWGNKDSKTASGTIAIADTGVVTGSSTVFTTQAKVGNYIIADGVDYQIVSITSNTVAKVINGTNNGKGLVTTVSGGTSYTLSEKPVSTAHESADSFSMGRSGLVFGVDATEAVSGGDNVSAVSVVSGKTRYIGTAPAVTFSGGAGSNAAATATIAGGVVTAITVTNTGTAYTSAPTVTIAKPARIIPTSGVNTTTNVITYATHGLTAGEEIKYYHGGGTAIAGLTNATSYYPGQVTTNTFQLYASAALGATAVATMTIATTGVNTTTNFITSTAHGLVDGAQLNYNNQGGTSITGLTSGSDYFVVNKTVDTFQLALTSGGAAIDITGTGNNSQTFASTGNYDLTGTGNNAQYFEIQAAADQATATAALGDGAVGGSQHAGWVKRTVGTGGRAGRVQYETLVAMGSITGDQADDVQFRDS